MYGFVLVLAISALLAQGKYQGHINEAGLAIIKEFEGFEPTFKNGSAFRKGLRIGYGHACDYELECSVPINGKYDVPLRLEDAHNLLLEDLTIPGRYESCVHQTLRGYETLNENQFSALVSYTFHMGCIRLSYGGISMRIDAGDILGASQHFTGYDTPAAKVNTDLRRRLEAERALFCTGGLCVTCQGTVTDSTSIYSSPYTSSDIRGSLTKGQVINITGRYTGSNVNGNIYWLNIGNFNSDSASSLSYSQTDFVSASYIHISSNNGATYCSTT